MDILQDCFSNGRKFRTLTIVDDFTRECPAIEVDTSLPGARVVRVMDRLAQTEESPGRSSPTMAGIQRKGAGRLGEPSRGQVALNRPGETDAKRLHRDFNGKFRDECPGPELVRRSWGRPEKDRGLEPRVQHGTPAQFAGLRDPAGVRGAFYNRQPEAGLSLQLVKNGGRSVLDLDQTYILFKVCEKNQALSNIILVSCITNTGTCTTLDQGVIRKLCHDD